MKMKKLIRNVSTYIHNLFGIDIVVARGIKSSTKGLVCLNIGAGDWSYKGWINLDYSSKWYSKIQKNNQYIEYDIRKDKLPFEDDTVDCIFCSHVIEHIEDEFIYKLFDECYRVLKKGGIVRFACPDAEFLWQMTKCGKDYWCWRKKWCDKVGIDFNSLRPVDFLVREIATSKMIGYIRGNKDDYEEAFNNMEMLDFFDYIKRDVVFDNEFVGNHINYWTYDKAEKNLKESGFLTVVRSKYAGTISPYMKNRVVFDDTFPEMSLYFEAIK